jgi:hypothetical protein
VGVAVNNPACVFILLNKKKNKIGMAVAFSGNSAAARRISAALPSLTHGMVTDAHAAPCSLRASDNASLA